jgi:hypothetical protein
MSKDSIKNKISYEILKNLVCRRRESTVKKGNLFISAYEVTYLKRYFKLSNNYKKCSFIEELGIPYRRFFPKKQNDDDDNICEVLLETFELKV